MSTDNILYITGEAVFGTIVLILLVVVIVKRGPCAKRQPESETESFNIQYDRAGMQNERASQILGLDMQDNSNGINY